jgi:ADP-ribose pyrophosphatase
VYSSNPLELYEESPNLGGTEKVYIRGIRKDYSTVVPFVSNKEILVVKSYRHLVDSIQIEVHQDIQMESPEEAAIRELKEETGYFAQNVVQIGDHTLDYSMFEQKGNLSRII